MDRNHGTRRSLLRGLVAIAGAGLAGCGKVLDRNTDSSTLTPAPVPETQSASPDRSVPADVEIEVTDVVRRRSFFYQIVEDVASIGVAGQAGRQYLFVSFDRRGRRPYPSDLRLDTGSASFQGTLIPGLPDAYESRLVIDPWGRADPIDGVADWTAFELPAPLEVSRGKVRPLPGHAPVYELPESLLDALGRTPPEFSVREVTFPDAVGPRESVSFAVTVRNRGRTGTFRGVLSWTDARGPAPQQTPVAGSIPPGTHTLHGTFDSLQHFDGSEITFQLDTPGGTTTRVVTVV